MAAEGGEEVMVEPGLLIPCRELGNTTYPWMGVTFIYIARKAWCTSKYKYNTTYGYTYSNKDASGK